MRVPRTSLSLHLLLTLAPQDSQLQPAGVVSVSALFQCRSRTNRDLLCLEHSPGACESRRNFGCLPNCQEPAATEATHGPDTGMLPMSLSVSVQYPQLLRVRSKPSESSLLRRQEVPWEAGSEWEHNLSSEETEEVKRKYLGAGNIVQWVTALVLHTCKPEFRSPST